MGFSIKVHDALLRRRMAALARGFTDSEEAKKVITESSKAGMRVAIEKAPRQDGDLKRAIKLKPLEGSLQGGFEVNIQHAAPQNFGWRDKRTGVFHEGKFFMEAGYEATKDRANKEMKKAIKAFISR